MTGGPSIPSGRPCVFFDRDGVVNHPPRLARYVRTWEEFDLIPGFLDALRVARDRGYEAAIVTNQKGLSTGALAPGEVDRIHRNLEDRLAKEGLALRALLVCPAADDAHPDRKPNPGMLIEAARRHGFDLRRSWIVGDQEKDIEAGRRAGCRTIRVCAPGTPTRADHLVPDVAGLAVLFRRVL